jgi:hypothetical protein
MSTNGAGANVGTSDTDVGDFGAVLLDINPTYNTAGYPNVWTQFTVVVSGVPSQRPGGWLSDTLSKTVVRAVTNSDYIGIDTVQYNGGCGPNADTRGSNTDADLDTGHSSSYSESNSSPTPVSM